MRLREKVIKDIREFHKGPVAKVSVIKKENRLLRSMYDNKPYYWGFKIELKEKLGPFYVHEEDDKLCPSHLAHLLDECDKAFNFEPSEYLWKEIPKDSDLKNLLTTSQIAFKGVIHRHNMLILARKALADQIDYLYLPSSRIERIRGID